MAEGAFGSGGDGGGSNGGGGDGGAGECPAATPLSDAECAGAVSNCWSPGQPDTGHITHVKKVYLIKQSIAKKKFTLPRSAQ